ncbi:transcription/translation regulatory transformer protein RfaH [Aeromonas hydrophila]|uniref:transcription/translation regulatory transformer protein RfaH n=1 Tax=Aeromonas hydrophila TaxID=644 RepID=UPI001B3A457B|nr:transcription/translation regulatory transformer protein RfaH [Aeromonas hydrophila]MCF7680555.1 transcription/translation regulatory transformer protein RfaH [Aeromonas hydrophila]MCF7774334.1 transcription/translation regulatory transformer protein RfaH [Aeromonas hydrophila]
MKKWYLAYCKPKEEARARARAHLEAQGIESYYPMVEIEKLRRGKRVPVREPMFPNYLFIYVDLEEVTPVTLKSTRGISRIIHFGREWTSISSQLVYQLMSRDDSDEARASYASLPTQGDKVLIESGPLAGFEAIYLEPDGDKRAILLVSLLNQETSSSFDNQSFRRLD